MGLAFWFPVTQNKLHNYIRVSLKGHININKAHVHMGLRKNGLMRIGKNAGKLPTETQFFEDATRNSIGIVL